MLPNTISVKELRHNLPAIREKIERGKEFVLIYRSRPFAKITPLNTYPSPTSYFGAWDKTDGLIIKNEVSKLKKEGNPVHIVKLWTSCSTQTF